MVRNEASDFVNLPESMLKAFESRFSDMRFVWQQMDASASGAKEERNGELNSEGDEALAHVRLKSIKAIPTDDAGDYALAALGTFELHLSLAGSEWPLARAWQRLEELVVFMHQNRWECLVGAALVQGVECLPQSTWGERAAVSLACRIEWQQLVLLGPPGDGSADAIPTPCYSHVPKVGRSHEADYLPLEEK